VACDRESYAAVHSSQADVRRWSRLAVGRHRLAQCSGMSPEGLAGCRGARRLDCHGAIVGWHE
jgi:hypothetical protein